MNHSPKNGQMGDTEPPNNTLHKIKHSRSSIVLDYIQSQHIVLKVGSKGATAFLARSYLAA